MKTILTLLLLATLTACGGNDAADDPTMTSQPVDCSASAVCG